jgi:hypothetical protein
MPPSTIQARASSGGGNPVLPTIYLENGRLPWNVDEVERIVIAAGGYELYHHADMVVRPIKSKVKASDNRDTFSWQLHEVSALFLVDLLTRIIRFQRYDVKRKKWVDVDCPEKLAKIYLSRVGKWKIPELQGVINTPFIREDGSLCERPGYDLASKLLFDPEGQSFPTIPGTPSKEDALQALSYINKTLFKDFPFVGDVDRAVTLSGLLTAFDQRVTASAPLHSFSAPIAGTGKSLLVDLISIVLSGHPAPVIALGRNDEELEKRIETALIASDAIISLDNINRELTSDVLSQALTQQLVKIRLLGESRQVMVPATTTFFANGNNLVIGGDLPRRTLLCKLDAKVERPELREFEREVTEIAYDERVKLVVAVLTILRAWQVATPSEKASVKAKPLGLFKRWSQRVRAPLLWLGCANPCDSIKDIRAKDPALAEFEIIMLQWKRKLGTTMAYKVQQVIEYAIPDLDFFNALAVVALSKYGPMLNNDRLGRWLSRNENKISGKLRLERAGKSDGYPLWRVTEH